MPEFHLLQKNAINKAKKLSYEFLWQLQRNSEISMQFARSLNRDGCEAHKRRRKHGAGYRERLLEPSTFTGSRSALECAFAPCSPLSSG